jgi:hypothetical protein
MIGDRLEAARRRAPELAGGLVGLVVDNPAQFAMITAGSYVVTRMMARAVRPYGPAGVLMTAAASYGVCWWLMAEARRRGILEFRVRDPHGELVTLAELGLGPCGCGQCGDVSAPPG